MAEFALASSFIGVIDVALTLTEKLYSYINKVIHARKIIEELVNELTSLIGVTTALQNQAKQNKYNMSIVQTLQGALSKCVIDLGQVNERLDRGDNRVGFGQRLMWPLKEKDTMEVLAKIGRTKALLILALSADQAAMAHVAHQYLLDIQNGVDDTQALIDKNLQVSTDNRNVAYENLHMSSVINETANRTAARVSEIQRGLHDLDFAGERQKTWQDAQDARQLSEDQHNVLRWLDSGIDTISNHTEALKLNQAGTGSWFIQGTDFKEWLTTTGKHIWLQGMVGAGKTVLMSTIIETTKFSITASCGLCYFYFDFKEGGKQTIVNMLGNVVAQLCVQRAFPDLAISLYAKHRIDGAPSEQLLRTCLKGLSSLFPTIYIFLDALDECPQQDQLNPCIELFCTLKNARVLVTSRPDRHLITKLKNCPLDSILIQTEAVNQDVKLYVEIVVQQQFKRFGKEINDEITAKLVSGAKGIYVLTIEPSFTELISSYRFRWVKYQIDVLKKCRTGNQVKSFLNNLPKDLLITYERILEAIPEEDESFARRALLFLVFAQRPPTVLELAEMMTIEIGSARLSHDSRFVDPTVPGSTQGLLDQILGICGSLVLQQNDNMDTGEVRIGLAHVSVQEYLLSSHIRAGKVAKYALERRGSNEEILRICLTYLQWEEFEGGPCLSTKSYNSRLQKYPFFQYASTNWFKHVVDSDMEKDIVCREARKLLSVDRNTTFRSWIQAYSVRDGNIWEHYMRCMENNDTFYDPLYYSSKWGFLASLKAFLPHADIADTHRESYINRLLAVASKYGHTSVVQFLLEQGAMPGGFDKSGNTAFELAIKYDQPAVARMLLKHNKDANLVAREEWLPWRKALHFAINLCQEDQLEILLETQPGSDIFIDDRHIRSWLDYALSIGSSWQVVDILLKSLVNNKKAKESSSFPYKSCVVGNKVLPYIQAISNLDVFKLLLKYGCYFEGRPPLFWKIAFGEKFAAQTVTMKSITSSPSYSDGDALRWAATFGHLEMSETLLRSKPCASAHIDDEDEAGRTPLHFAAHSCNTALTKLLLDNGANISHADKYGHTALHHVISVERCRPDILRYILRGDGGEKGVTTHASLYPEFWARTTKLDIISLLVIRGVEVSARDSKGNTALQLAVKESKTWPAEMLPIIPVLAKAELNCGLSRFDDEVILHLVGNFEDRDWVAARLEKVFDVNMKDENGETLLHLASSVSGSENIIRVLLGRGAVFTRDNEGRAPLHLAVKHNFTTIAKLILEYGGNALDTDNTGKYPLHYATSDVMANILLTCGADISAKTSEGMTPLHCAIVEDGSVELIRYLIHRGAIASLADDAGQTSLHYACSSMNATTAVVELLLAYSSDKADLLDIRDKNGHTALHCVILKRMLNEDHEEAESIIDLLLRTGSNPNVANHFGETALNYAAEIRNTKIVSLLLDYGADIYQRDKAIVSLEKGDAAQHAVTCPPVLEILLNRGYDIEHEDEKGWTLLSRAVGLGLVSTVALLIARGGNISTADREGITPLHYTIGDCKNLDMIALLLRYGADATAVTAAGLTVFHAMYDGGRTQRAFSRQRSDFTSQMAHTLRSPCDLINILLSHGADINGADFDLGETPLLLAVRETCSEMSNRSICKDDRELKWLYHDPICYMLECGATVNKFENRQGRTILHVALQECPDPSLIELLLQYGGDSTLVDQEGLTVLHITLLNSALSKLNRQLVIELLMKNGAPLNTGDKRGRTALHYAALNDCGGVFKILLAYGADQSILDIEGKTAEDLMKQLDIHKSLPARYNS